MCMVCVCVSGCARYVCECVYVWCVGVHDGGDVGYECYSLPAHPHGWCEQRCVRVRARVCVCVCEATRYGCTLFGAPATSTHRTLVIPIHSSTHASIYPYTHTPIHPYIHTHTPIHPTDKCSVARSVVRSRLLCPAILECRRGKMECVFLVANCP